MTTLHKYDDQTLIMTTPSNDQYLITNVCVCKAIDVDTKELEQVPFDAEVFNMVERSLANVHAMMNETELEVLKNWIADKVEAGE